MNSRTVTIILIILVIGVAVVWFGYSGTPSTTTNTTVTYSCAEGKTIMATFSAGETKQPAGPDQPPTPSGSVALTLSDGRTMTLPQTISADGTRYANTDESFVFWGKGNGALVLEDNQQKSYIGCIRVADASGLPQVYANSEQGFSLRLPDEYTTDAAYQYQELGPNKSISGTKFTIAPIAATSTNLASDTYISVEEIPQTADCTAALFLDQGAKASTIEESGTTYSVASTTGAGAGNRYEETVYALPGTNPCIAVRYFIHYGVFENYPAGAVQEFNKQELLATFDSIRRTLVVVQ